MRKGLGGFFRMIFSLLILAAVGYNTWQVRTLRAEVESLKRARGAAVQSHEGVVDVEPLLARARHHAEQAQSFLRKKQYADAQRALQAAADALERASRSVRDGGSGALATLRRTLRSLSEEADALWQRQEGKESEKK